MLVFITHPKYFDKKSLYRKKPELVYIFNSLSLYKELSKKYKCVNLDINYKVKNENFFPDSNTKDIFKRKMVDIKRNIYSYFKKKYYNIQRKMYVMRGGHKDVTYRIVMDICRRMEKNSRDEATVFMEEEIIKLLGLILEFEKSEKFVKDNQKFIIKIFNLTNSLYRSYIYSFSDIRGVEVFGDVFKFNYFLNAVNHYTFDKKDIYNNDFHFLYKKVLVRLFVENIHKNNIKLFVNHNIEYYKDSEWL